jgi:hypothetical protein
VIEELRISSLGVIDASVLEGVQRIYDEHLREAVHPRW